MDTTVSQPGYGLRGDTEHSTAGVSTSIIQEGDPAPNTSATFTHIPRQFAHTPFGRIAFTASIAGPGVIFDKNTGIWIDAFSSSLQLLVQEGDPVPDLTDVAFGVLSDPYANYAGQIAFTAHLRGPFVEPESSLGLFATDQTGQIHLIARTGDLVTLNTPVNPERIIREITFTHDPDSGRKQFAADGTMLFTVLFMDWSSAIMTTRVGCRVDVNADGTLDILDFLEFRDKFGTEDPPADFIPDNKFDIFDFLAFQNEFVSGCN